MLKIGDAGARELVTTAADQELSGEILRGLPQQCYTVHWLDILARWQKGDALTLQGGGCMVRFHAWASKYGENEVHHVAMTIRWYHRCSDLHSLSLIAGLRQSISPPT